MEKEIISMEQCKKCRCHKERCICKMEKECKNCGLPKGIHISASPYQKKLACATPSKGLIGTYYEEKETKTLSEKRKESGIRLGVSGLAHPALITFLKEIEKQDKQFIKDLRCKFCLCAEGLTCYNCEFINKLAGEDLI